MGGAGGSWSWPVVPWTLELEIGGMWNRRWLGFLEGNLRGWLDFFGKIYERRVLARKCGSDKYRAVKDFFFFFFLNYVNGLFYSILTFFFNFNLYIFILLFLVPKPIHTKHLSLYCHSTNRNNWRGWWHIKIIIKKSILTLKNATSASKLKK